MYPGTLPGALQTLSYLTFTTSDEAALSSPSGSAQTEVPGRSQAVNVQTGGQRSFPTKLFGLSLGALFSASAQMKS